MTVNDRSTGLIPTPYPAGPQRRNLLGGVGLVVGFLALCLSAALAAGVLFGVLGLGLSICGLLVVHRRPKGAAVGGIIVSALALFVTVVVAASR